MSCTSLTMTPLRVFAVNFAQEALGPEASFDFKVSENVAACRSGRRAYNVFVRLPGKSRGKCIGTLIDSPALREAERAFFSARNLTNTTSST